MKSILFTLVVLFSFNYSFAQLNKIDIELYSPNTFLALNDEFTNIEVIGVGEATHGTSEFFTFKAELFKYLVQNQGFMIFGLEAQAAEAMEINDYINGKDGNPNDLLRSLNFWAWETEEVKELIEWMREYNATHSEKIEFFGFDMQLIDNSILKLYSYFEKTDSEELNNAKKAYEKIRNNFEYFKLSDQEKNETLNRIQEVKEYLLNNKAKLISDTSELEWKNALYLSNVILECEKIFRFPFKQRDALRDQSMVNLVESYREIFGKGKTMLWAHNGHITKVEKYGKKTLGMYLNEALGNTYFSIGLLFNSGSFRAQKGNGYNVEVFNLEAAPSESILNFLSNNGNLYYLNFESQPESVKDKFRSEQYVYDVPANFKKTKSFAYKPFILADSFDAVVFFNQTSAAIPLK